MNNRFLYLLQVAMVVAIGYLFFRDYQLNREIDDLKESKKEVRITPVNPNTKVADPVVLSPFDKPNTDPLADQFPPESAKMPGLTSLKFEKMVHNFGRIREGERVKTIFTFTNTGKNPLVITNAKGSCGCTVPRWPTHPVKAGGSDEIAVEFNSAGKQGETEKTVTVIANTSPPSTVLTIKSTVIPKDK